MATKPWDGKMKRVLTEIPQDTVDWLLAGAKFISVLSSELEDETIHPDLLLEISIDGQQNIYSMLKFSAIVILLWLSGFGNTMSKQV